MMMMPLYHDSYGHGRNSNLLLLDLMKCVVLLLPPFRTIWADQNPPFLPKKVQFKGNYPQHSNFLQQMHSSFTYFSLSKDNKYEYIFLNLAGWNNGLLRKTTSYGRPLDLIYWNWIWWNGGFPPSSALLSSWLGIQTTYLDFRGRVVELRAFFAGLEA